MTKVVTVVDEALGHQKSKPKLGGKDFSQPNGGCSGKGWQLLAEDGDYKGGGGQKQPCMHLLVAERGGNGLVSNKSDEEEKWLEMVLTAVGVCWAKVKLAEVRKTT